MPPTLAAACAAAAHVREAGFQVLLTGAPGPRQPRRARRTGTNACAAGSGLPSQLATSAPSRRTFLTSILRPERCCARKLDPTRAVRSQSSLRQQLLPCRPLTSVCSSCDGCGCRSHWRPAIAVAEATLTPWETTAQLVPRLAFWRPGPSHSSMQSPRYAEKVVRELPATSGSPT